jgi:hypothetical protein
VGANGLKKGIGAPLGDCFLGIFLEYFQKKSSKKSFKIF